MCFRRLARRKITVDEMSGELNDLKNDLVSDFEDKLNSQNETLEKQPDEPFERTSRCLVREPCGKHCPAYGAE